MSERRLDLVGTGSMVVDRISHTPRLIGADEKVLLQPDPDGRVVRELVGGVTLNHLGWASLLGLRTGIFGRQADDAAGRLLRSGMRALGIERDLDLSGGASSFANVYLDPRGERAIYMARGATAEFAPDDVSDRHRAIIESAHWVSTEISQVPLDTVVRVLELARDAGALTILDLDVRVSDAVPGLGSETEFHAALSGADVIKASRSALMDVVEGDDLEAIAKEFDARYRPQAIVLTLGEEGCAVYVDGRLTRVPGARVEAVDTTGAGDAFLGGLIAGRVRGLDWYASARLANACGAACCERLGGFPDDPEACLAALRAHHEACGGRDLPGPLRQVEGDAADALDAFLRVAQEEFARADAELDRDAVRAAAAMIREAERVGGRVHVTGVGKPEHVAHYGASLLSSTGTPAVFLHGTEASHGSVGQLRGGDVVIAISHSGETVELLQTAEAARGMDAHLIAITARRASALGRLSDLVLEAGVLQEGGPLDLAPRASVLVQMLVLQALSVELQAGAGFSSADYARRHPAGALGARSRGDS